MRYVVAGAGGRMGAALIRAVAEDDGAELAGAFERTGSDALGQDAGVAADVGPLGVTVTDDPLSCLAQCDVLLDFTSPSATLDLADLAAQARIVHVIGTTGLTEDALPRLDAAARHARIVRAGNMSLGVNLLVALARKVAAALDEDFDIEVVEMHHRHKVDAPSGTALMLGEAAAEGRGVDLEHHGVFIRHGQTGARRRGDIGFATLRGGSVIGEHEIMFASEGEQVSLSHRATDRAIFARGALKAAQWAYPQKPGHYSMLNVLGLDD